VSKNIVRAVAIALSLACFGALAASAAASPRVTVRWMKGFAAPGTPARYDKVGVVAVGPAKAKNVLVLEPGTSAGGGYFVPLAKWIVARAPGWQVWSVERRENLLEDQSELNLAKRGQATATQLFNYYLGYITDPSVKTHMKPIGADPFAKQWGMNVAVHDLRDVITAAHRLGGKVVLGGHSLGGTVVTAYATWNFGGHAGANGLAGLVYIDGGSFPAETATAARASLTAFNDPKTIPWLTFGGIPAPFAGIFSSAGAVTALIAPNGLSLAENFSLLPSDLKPSVPATSLAEYGFALNVGTSPPALIAAQAHLGKGLAASGNPRGWDGTGALTPLHRFAQMFGGAGLNGVDGVEWYFPERLSLDGGAVGNGDANPAQSVLGVHSTMAHKLPRSLKMYAFGAALGGPGVLAQTRALARQSHIPSRNLTLINRQSTYAHNDPAGAYPHNVFFAHLVPFLVNIGVHK
jgi:pimeloyl-ACP methyl ester carboxylesterase